MTVENRSLESTLLFDPHWGWEGEEIILILEILLITSGVVLLKSKTMHKIITWIPESCIWVTFGIAFRAFRTALNVTLIGGKFNKHHIILNILIPPIILEGSYKLYSKELLFQIFGILNFAVLGTAFCIGCVGLGIYYLGRGISPNDSLLLATIVSAVDPVTVLAIFDQIKVTPSLYVLIFGESLLNDGVTLAAFESLNAMSKYDGTPSGVAYFLGIVSVITRTLGGAIIGILCGLISAIYTKFNNSKAYQALPLILLSYVCFMTAETLSFSGIAGIIGCGLVQRRYAFINIGSRSRHALARTTKFFAAVGEAIIFILLGEASYGASWKKRDMLFIMSVISICIVSRFIMVYTLGYICNKTKLTHISAKHLFVISYGGLRGAMSYVMIKTITVEGNKERKNKIDIDLFNEVTLSVVLFTIYILGGTVRFVAKAMKLRTSETIHTDRLLTIIIDRITQHATAGMESILGGGIRRMHSWIETMELFDNKYIRPYISRNQGLKSQLEVQKVMKKNLLKEAALLHKTSQRLKSDMIQTSGKNKKVVLDAKLFPEPGKMEVKETEDQIVLHPIDDEEYVPLIPEEVIWLRRLRLRRLKTVQHQSIVQNSMYSSDDEDN